ncbi:MAG: DUF502 domain-containing protein [Salinivirgaceae bacterium]|nr:DUF502 domain-containing protein [Salinivirgaceae bacterium]
MKKIIAYFLQGVLYSAPIGITIYIIYMVFKVVDGSIQRFLLQLFNINIPGLGVVVLFILLALLGFLGSSIIAQPFKRLFKRILERAPLIKVIYSAFNDLLSAFAGKNKKFNKPVLVKVNTISNLEKLGFVTEQNLEKINELEKVAVYFPHSYNFSGELFIVPKEHIKPIDIPSADVMKFIVSGGVAGWDNK